MRRNLLILGVVILFLFGLFGVSKLLKFGFTPVNSLFQGIGNFFYNFSRVDELLDLEEENQKLRGLESKLKEVTRENSFLRNQLDLPRSEEPFKLLPARVIGLNDHLLINNVGGIGDGVVTYGNILVGTIIAPGVVRMIHHPESILPVTTQTSRVSGEARGSYGLNLVLDLPPSEERMIKGEKVLTSGLGGVFPKGLIVGEIKEIDFNENKTSKRAQIEVGFDQRSLDSLFVISGLDPS
jgi:rod shape-determining protein MreC